MNTADLKPGMKVQIVATDEFYAFVDGWIGTFEGWQSGYPLIVCKHQDGIDKTFLVPPDQLRQAPYPVNSGAFLNG